MRQKKPIPPALASRPFTRAEALEQGVAERRLRGDDLARPFHGVRTLAVPHDTLTLCRAYGPRMSSTSFFSSVTAAKLLGLPLPHRLQRERAIHVAVPSPTRGIKARGVVGHKVQLMGDDRVLWHGVPVSAPPRAFCELAGLLSLPELVAVGDHIIHWRMPLATSLTSRQPLPGTLASAVEDDCCSRSAFSTTGPNRPRNRSRASFSSRRG